VCPTEELKRESPERPPTAEFPRALAELIGFESCQKGKGIKSKGHRIPNIS